MILRVLGLVTDEQRTFVCPRCKQSFQVVLVHVHGRDVVSGERFTGKVWKEPAQHNCGLQHQSAIIGSMF